MKKRQLFVIAPMTLLMGLLVGCKTTTTEYTVKFDTDGGTEIAAVKVKNGSTVARPSETPIKSGFTFTDWYIAKDSEAKFDFDNTKIVKDTTIYAHYTLEPSIEFSISPEGPLHVKKGEEKQLQINFTDPKGYEAAKDIKWTFDDKYIEKVSEAEDHMTFKFKGKELTDDIGTFINVNITSKSGGKAKEKSCQVHVETAVTKSNINWCTSPIAEGHGFDGTTTLFMNAYGASNIIFKKDSSTDGAFAGETTNDKIYAKYDSATTTLTVWSNDKIAFEDDDRFDMGVGTVVGPFAYGQVTKIDLANVDTSAMTDMSLMFANCYSLETIENIGNLDTSNVTKMNDMFSMCSALTSLDVSKFDTKKVTTMEDMFTNCIKLTSLDVSSFDTSEVTSMKYMFCSVDTSNNMQLSSIKFGDKFDTSKVTDMSGMFYNCSKLTSIDLSKFNTSSVSKMPGMFCGCSELTSLDLTNFSFDELTLSAQMFEGCSKLIRIYAKTGTDLSKASKILNSDDMFKDCTLLQGGKGTAYDSTKKDKSYARIDGGSSDKGYFTDKTQSIEITLNYKNIGGTDYYIGNDAGAFNVGNKFKAVVNYDSTKLSTYNAFFFTPSDGQSSYTLTKDSADKTKQILVTSAKKVSDGTSVLDNITVDETEGFHYLISSSLFTESIIIECTVVKDTLNSLIVSAAAFGS